MKRATRHRKRHKPPGPCGILWQMSKPKGSKSKIQEEEEESIHRKEDQNEESALFPNDEDSNSNEKDLKSAIGRKVRNGEQYDASTPPAWTAMQRSLDICTPYLSLWTQGNIRKRHELLRPHVPRKCILLPEILCGGHDLKILDPECYLCAWVHSIEERNSHHGIWTVELKDETGATIRAWMEPNFVKKELQKAQQAEETSSNKGVVRVGVVWMLANFSMIAINNNDHGGLVGNNKNSGVVERMLVVSEKHILRVWTPEIDRIQYQPNEEEDSPEAQRKYLNWMERRNALTEDRIPCGSDTDEGRTENEDDKIDEEKEHDYRQRKGETQRLGGGQRNDHHSYGRIVGEKEYQESHTEMSALTMTADDENVAVNSLHRMRTDCGDGHISATKGPQQSGEHSTMPLPLRNINPGNSNGIFVNKSNDRVDNCDKNNCENGLFDNNYERVSVQLHTQESSQREDNTDMKCEEKNHKSSPRQVKKRPEPTDHVQRKRSQKRKMCRKKEDGANSSNPDRDHSRDNDRSKPRRFLSLNYTSPAHLPLSVWNTPDPFLLEMIEMEEESIGGEDVKTVQGEDLSSCFFSTQNSNERNNSPDHSFRRGGAIITSWGSKEDESHYIEKSTENQPQLNEDESEFFATKASPGCNLIDWSNLDCIDIVGLSESDSE